MNSDNPRQDILDAATQRRLQRLRSMPIDTGGVVQRFDALLEEAASPPTVGRVEAGAAGQGADAAPGVPAAPGRGHWRRYPVHWWRPIGGIAAAVVLMAVIAVTLLAPRPGAVEAAPSDVAQLHRALISGEVDAHIRAASDMSQANDHLRSDWPTGLRYAAAPRVPDPAMGRVLSCCVHRLEDRPVASVLMDVDGRIVSVMVAHNTHLRAPRDGQVVEHRGYRFSIHRVNGTELLMVEHGDRWVGLVSDEAPRDVLLALGVRMLASGDGPAAPRS